MEKEKKFNPKRARIKILSEIEVGASYPKVCVQCAKCPCIEVCENDAISVEEETRAILIDDGRCTYCGDCVAACPFGAIKLVPGEKYVINCDLCGGNPICVKICPTQAIEYKYTRSS